MSFFFIHLDQQTRIEQARSIWILVCHLYVWLKFSKLKKETKTQQDHTSERLAFIRMMKIEKCTIVCCCQLAFNVGWIFFLSVLFNLMRRRSIDWVVQKFFFFLDLRTSSSRFVSQWSRERIIRKLCSHRKISLLKNSTILCFVWSCLGLLVGSRQARENSRICTVFVLHWIFEIVKF